MQPDRGGACGVRAVQPDRSLVCGKDGNPGVSGDERFPPCSEARYSGSVKLREYLVNLAPYVVSMEALRPGDILAMEHEAKLMAPQFAKPCVRSSRDDRTDEQARLLMTIPGVGRVTVTALPAGMGNARPGAKAALDGREGSVAGDIETGWVVSAPGDPWGAVDGPPAFPEGEEGWSKPVAAGYAGATSPERGHWRTGWCESRGRC